MKWWKSYWWIALASVLFLTALGIGVVLRHILAPPPIYQLRIRADLGTWVLLISSVALLGGIGILAGLWWMRRLLQKSLARVQQEYTQAKHRFIYHLDHEVRKHLAVLRAQIASLSDMAEEGSLKTAQMDMLAQVERLDRLLSQLRELAELKEREIERLPVDVVSLLQELMETIRAHPECTRRRVRLMLPQAPWPLPPLRGDRDLLFQAFFNLLDNAIKFTRPGDWIEIRAFEDQRSVVIEVADTGCGIDPKDLPHIFEELYRGSNARGREGSGLGLALVKAVVERHDGAVSVRSRTGQGTVFTIRLPSGS
ncbi:ATP-binding protein [Thermoflexus hugenholtzii]